MTDLPAPVTAALLLVSTDLVLIDDVLRLAAAAGVEVHVAPDPASAAQAWGSAPLVLVGNDAATSGRARRPGVVLVSLDPDDGAVWKRAHQIGAEHVVVLPDGEGWLLGRMADAVTGPSARSVVGVLGGCGGAGASALSVGLAIAARRGGDRVVLADLDPGGGGLDVLLGAEQLRGLRWPDLAATSGRLASAALSEALLHAHGLTVVSSNRDDPSLPATAAEAVLRSVLLAHDVAVIDLARSSDSLHDVVLPLLTDLVIVVPAEVRAAAAAVRTLAGVRASVESIRVAVRAPGPTGLTADEVAAGLGLDLLTALPDDVGVRRAADRGELAELGLRTSWSRACTQAWSVLDPRRSRRAA